MYENNVLQFFAHEEGRIRKKDNDYVFDYFLKDHLGNIRMVLTDEHQTDAYPPASLETANLNTEKLIYDIPDNSSVRVPKNTVTGYPSDTYTNPNDYIQRLNGNGTKIGTSKVLKVMSGDKINVKVSSWYKLNSAGPGMPVSSLLGCLLAPPCVKAKRPLHFGRQACLLAGRPAVFKDRLFTLMDWHCLLRFVFTLA